MKRRKWISPLVYAQMVKKSKQQVYMDIRLGKIKSRIVRKVVDRIEVLEPVDKKA